MGTNPGNNQAEAPPVKTLNLVIPPRVPPRNKRSVGESPKIPPGLQGSLPGTWRFPSHPGLIPMSPAARPTSNIVIPSSDDIKRNRGYYSYWKDNLSNLNKEIQSIQDKSLKEHMEKVKSMTTKSLSLGQRLLLWMSTTIKNASSKWFTHALLMILLLLYACVGGIIFQTIEGPYEVIEKQKVVDVRREIMHEMYLLSQRRGMTEVNWKKDAEDWFLKYEKKLYDAFQHGYKDGVDQKKWTFLGAVFYCCTIFTTIGYGHIAPSTGFGRAVTILYAFIGIPIFLMCLADFGKLFTRLIKHLIAACRRVYYTGRCRRARKAAPVKALSKGVAAGAQALHDISHLQAPDLHVPQTPATAESEPEPFEVDDEFDLPISLALGMLFLFLVMGAVLFSFLESWSLGTSFYFVFISMSTIGFGDIVPEHEEFMIISNVFIIFGMALTSMCINVVQEKISHTFAEASAKIGAAIGMNVEEVESSDDEASSKKGEKHRHASAEPTA